MMAPQSAELARRAKVGELVLMHFSTRYAGEYEQLVEEARAVFPNVRAELP
jgi:ribonuclease Z